MDIYAQGSEHWLPGVDGERSATPLCGDGCADLLLDAVGEAVIATDLDGRIIRWNQEATRLYGWSSSEAVGRNVVELTVPEGVADRAGEILATLRSGQRWEGTFTVRHRAGRRFEARVVDTPVFGDSGELVAIIGVSSDLTDWHRSESDRAAAERRWSHGFANSAVPSAILDLEGINVGANPALCDLLGLPPEEIIGRPTEDFIVDGPDFRAGAEEMIAGRCADVQDEAVLGRPDGRLVHVLVSASLVRDDDLQPDYFLVQMQDITARKESEVKLQRAERRSRETLDDLVGAVARTIELRDPYTAGHQERVAAIATVIAEELGFDPETVKGIGVAASLHDIGKIAVPAEILTRPGQLNPAEFEIMKQHPQTGHDILCGVEFPWPVARMVLEHHERIDGSGYPLGLAGTEILVESQVIAVADMLEAISAHRPYRPARGLVAAFDIVIRQRGTSLDERVVDAAVRRMSDIAVLLDVGGPDRGN